MTSSGGIYVEGHNGQVAFDGFTITIMRKGFRARTTIGKGEKQLPVHSISAVQWKPAGALTNGYIEFTIAGGVEMRSRAGSATVHAATNENAVLFTKKQMPQFEQLRAAVDQALRTRFAPPAVGTVVTTVPVQRSVADELAKLGALYQQGLLSEQEFAAQKARLLS